MTDEACTSYARILDRIRNELSTSERRQAMEILNWVCCALRPLRVREVEDAIAFRPDCAKPTLSNRISRSIFEICGPLIEELPDGTVDTVHFSAKESAMKIVASIVRTILICTRYLLHQHSGPFVDHALANQSLAFSCVHYLGSMTTVLCDERMSHSPQALDKFVIDSLNGLHNYSHQFWPDHTLRFIKGSTTGNQPSDLMAMLEVLARSWRRERPTIQHDGKLQSSERLPSLNRYPEAREILRQVLAFREKSASFERGCESPKGLSPILYIPL